MREATRRPTFDEAQDRWRRGLPMDEVSAFARWRVRELGESPRAAIDRAYRYISLQDDERLDVVEWR